MRLLVFGATGQVARALAARAGPDLGVDCLGRDRADLADPAGCAACIAGAEVDAVINAAAYTAVDRAESEAALAQVVNGDAPGAMARVAAARGLPFLHVSTDYVFDGSGTRPWPVDAAPAPLGVYGRSKLAGEVAVRGAGGQGAAILRTSWVFSATGTNFVKTMLRLGRERGALRVVADQIGGPTPAGGIADALITMARAMGAGHPGGTWHLAGAPDTSWAGFAREIFAQAGIACDVTDIATADYPTPAARPLNSRLDCAALTADFGIPRPDWRAGLTTVLHELGEI
jgi:dTDP-4-dehydrorhamnose reductase